MLQATIALKQQNLQKPNTTALEAVRGFVNFMRSSEAEANGSQVKPKNMAIAAIAKSNNATLATRNTRDFDGLDLKIVNPFEAQ